MPSPAEELVNSDPLDRETENFIAILRGLPTDEIISSRRKTVRIGEAIPNVLTRYKIGQQTPEDHLAEHWKSIMGSPGLAQICQPRRIDPSGKLYIAVSDPVIRQELFFQRQQILQRIKSTPGCGSIRVIQFCQG